MTLLGAVIISNGCISLHRHPAKAPTSQPVASDTTNAAEAAPIPGLAPKPKPFIALPGKLLNPSGSPSTLLLEHASPDSPIPLSEYAKQPDHSLAAFHLRRGLSPDELTQKMGPPVQVADSDDPWLVYRLVGNRELWLHFSDRPDSLLDAADVVRGAEDGYARDRIFSAD